MIASERGPKEATTRHVLLTLGLHANQAGENAWPSQAHLAMRTNLSERAVRGHLNKAWRAGWVQIYAKRPSGNGWRLHEYVASVPIELEESVPLRPWEEDPNFQRTEPDAARHRPAAQAAAGNVRNVVPVAPLPGNASPTVAEPERPANDAQRPESGATTCGTSRQDVRNHVPTNSPRTLPKNSSGEGGSQASAPPPLSGMKKTGGEKKSSAKRRQELDAKLHKAVREFASIEDAKLAVMYATDIETVKAARRAVG